MTPTFKLSALALTAMLALAGAAQAEGQAHGVTVSTLGKSRAAVRGEVVRAARTVCAEAVADDIHGAYGSEEECVSATADAAFARMGAAPDRLAMARQAVLIR